MLDRERVLEILRRLDWSKGFNKEALLRVLLERNQALPNEFLSAIDPTEMFDTPEELVASVPDVVWTIHQEREQRARGRIEPPAPSEPTAPAEQPAPAEPPAPAEQTASSAPAG